MTTFAERRQRFDALCARLNQRQVAEAAPRFTCPCCAYPTLEERGHFDICCLCNWEDDGQDDHDAHLVLGGPNADYSLQQARENFDQHLIMYASNDAHAFPQNPKMLQLKQGLLAVYEQMLTADDELFTELERQEQQIQQEMLTIPQRRGPSP